MKRKYRIVFNEVRQVYSVCTYCMLLGWITVKEFQDEDIDFAKREAMELLEKLNEK